jgi:hypothetical protein
MFLRYALCVAYATALWGYTIGATDNASRSANSETSHHTTLSKKKPRLYKKKKKLSFFFILRFTRPVPMSFF